MSHAPSIKDADQKKEDDEDTKFLKEMLAVSKVNMIKKNLDSVKCIVESGMKNEEFFGRSIGALKYVFLLMRKTFLKLL